MVPMLTHPASSQLTLYLFVQYLTSYVSPNFCRFCYYSLMCTFDAFALPRVSCSLCLRADRPYTFTERFTLGGALRPKELAILCKSN